MFDSTSMSSQVPGCNSSKCDCPSQVQHCIANAEGMVWQQGGRHYRCVLNTWNVAAESKRASADVLRTCREGTGDKVSRS
jgi:hypothetical protein